MLLPYTLEVIVSASSFKTEDSQSNDVPTSNLGIPMIPEEKNSDHERRSALPVHCWVQETKRREPTLLKVGMRPLPPAGDIVRYVRFLFLHIA